MVRPKRIDERVDLPKNKDGKSKKKKDSSKPPENNRQAERIFDALWDINPVLSLCSQMQAVTGLRYSDASWLKYSDFINDDGSYKDCVDVIQQKVFNMIMYSKKTPVAEAVRKSTVRVFVNDSVKEIVAECQQINANSEYLFANKKSVYLDGDNVKQDRPMSVQSASEHHATVQKKLRLNYELGTHSWRAFFAMSLLNKGAEVLDVRDMLGHLSITSTNSYLHTFSDRLNKLAQKINLG